MALWGFALVEHKTEAVLISSRKEVEFTSVHLRNCEISTKQYLKYLGVGHNGNMAILTILLVNYSLDMDISWSICTVSV